MPPKKAKTEKQSADKASETVLEYLRKQNRPYSALEVFNNLHGVINKAQIAKTLTALAESNQITAKAYNKTWIYVANQDDFDIPTKEELDGMDGQITTLTESINTLKDEVKNLSSVLGGLNSSLTNEELEKQITELEIENAKYFSRLEALRAGGKQVSEADKRKIDDMYEKNRKLWKTRKRMCKDIVDTISEGVGKKPKAFMEELELETDELAGVDINVDPLASL